MGTGTGKYNGCAGEKVGAETYITGQGLKGTLLHKRMHLTLYGLTVHGRHSLL